MPANPEGLGIERRFTEAGAEPFDALEWKKRDTLIRNFDGTTAFEMRGVNLPTNYSQTAANILAQKYFRKAGIPRKLKPVPEKGVPKWLRRSAPDEKALAKLPTSKREGGETDGKELFRRLAGTWTWWGWKHDYFASEADARAFYDELCYMLAAQMASPNSPQWFNTGLNWAYGIEGPPQGHHFVDPVSGELERSTSAYEHPQPHACFIQSVSDDLVNEGGIMDLWTREARLFKFGSGTGSNFSSIRGGEEPLSGGGRSSGLMSFLKIGDRAAGAIKSGGTTRRAAKMVCLDMDHPDIEQFINWKVSEEEKVAALVAGSRQLQDHANEILAAIVAHPEKDEKLDPKLNRPLARAVRSALRDHVPETLVARVLDLGDFLVLEEVPLVVEELLGALVEELGFFLPAGREHVDGQERKVKLREGGRLAGSRQSGDGGEKSTDFADYTDFSEGEWGRLALGRGPPLGRGVACSFRRPQTTRLRRKTGPER